MTKLLARIDQIQLVLNSLIDECTDCDPDKTFIIDTDNR